MVGCQQPVNRGYTAVAPPPFADLLWGRGREGWVQSQNANKPPEGSTPHLILMYMKKLFIHIYKSPQSKGHLLSSYYRAQLVKLWISPSPALQIELCEGIMWLQRQADKTVSKETSDWKTLEASKALTSWALTWCKVWASWSESS